MTEASPGDVPFGVDGALLVAIDGSGCDIAPEGRDSNFGVRCSRSP